MSIRTWLEQNRDKYPTKRALRDACVAALNVTRESVKNHVTRVWESRAPEEEVEVEEPRGFELKGVRLLDRKPHGDVRSLKPGYGYTVSELADKWGMSQDTVRKRAREAGALKFVEIDGEWVQCVVNPGVA